jgi:nucleotide-binding universal stress UspA family protein
MAFKKILIAYEGSKPANRAFKIALKLAKGMNSKLLILDCINTSFSGSLMHGSDFDFESIVLKKLRTKAKKDMISLEKYAKVEGVNVESYITNSSSITNSILSFSKSHKVDLVVMGAHTRNRIAEFFLGSISNAVLHEAKIPVLIVR